LPQKNNMVVFYEDFCMIRKIINYTILLLFTIVLTIQCKKKDTCYQYDPGCELVDLSDTLDPVCGCDGVTYKNSGYATCIGHVKSYTKGACK